jgi:hypothetical protein
MSNRSKVRIYSITSSARASSVGGTSRPSALAVLRLITSSYLVGACTGRSAGFSPLRTHPGRNTTGFTLYVTPAGGVAWQSISIGENS